MTTIETRLGPVTGLERNGISVFLGIPFAEPPVGERRWMPPVPVSGRPEGVAATAHPPRCYQPPYMDVLQGRPIPGELSEDCLYLNIYTPEPDSKGRPVMVWIHGGAFFQGSANEYDGTVIARDNDVVVVAINYRLGVFGFMDLSPLGEAYKGSASLGFRDQIAALEWVRDNIADYGGDPNNVTIWGESAGGGSVLALIAAPSAKGLFHKAIACSPVEIMGPPQDNLSAIAAQTGKEGDDLLAHLREMDGKGLLALQTEGVVSPGASVDGYVITEQPSRAIRNNGGGGVPLIAGNNKDEGTFLVDAVPPEGYDLMLVGLGAVVANGDPAEYLAALEGLAGSGERRPKVIRVWQDTFRSSVLRAGLAACEAGPGGWVYSFEVPGNTDLGVTHASEIAFTFNVFKGDVEGAFSFHDMEDPKNKEIAEKWSRTLAHFARTGNPNGAGLPSWPQYDRVARSCLVVDREPRVAEDPDGEALRSLYGV